MVMPSKLQARLMLGRLGNSRRHCELQTRRASAGCSINSKRSCLPGQKREKSVAGRDGGQGFHSWCEVVLFAQPAVNVSCNAGGQRSFDAGAVAANQNRQ